MSNSNLSKPPIESIDKCKNIFNFKGKEIVSDKIPPSPKLSKKPYTCCANTKEALQQAIEHELKHGRKVHPNVDLKKLQKTVSNRISAKKSRMKRAQHTKDLEKSARELEDRISELRPKVENYERIIKILQCKRNSLLEQLERRKTESQFRQKIEKKRLEVNKLKEIEASYMQNLSSLNLSYGPQQSPVNNLALPVVDKTSSLMFYQHILNELPYFAYPQQLNQLGHSFGLPRSENFNNNALMPKLSNPTEKDFEN